MMCKELELVGRVESGNEGKPKAQNRESESVTSGVYALIDALVL